MADDTSNELNITKVEYSTKHNENFRPISNEQVTTVEISPTGSGKTHFYKNSPNTIMLMPTNALVRQHDGMITSAKAQQGERSAWDELNTEKCDYMTYDKFCGHLKHSDMSNINVIIDEAHLVLASESPIHYDLLRSLFERKFQYKELKLISATLRKEVLEIYDYRKERMSVVQYINTNFTPSIQFTRNLPVIDKTLKTLFFLNSIDKMIQVRRHYEEKCKGIKVVLLSADEEIPDTSNLAQYDLILSTCVLKQGYSIKCHIDQVVIHNIFNGVGAMDIIQYMARPRDSKPKVYVIPASTHFKKDRSKLWNVPNLATLLNEVAQTGELTDEQYQANEALSYNEFHSLAKTSKDGWNILGVTSFYEKKLRYYELMEEDGLQMIKSIKSIIPKATILIEDLEEDNKLSFDYFELDDDVTDLLDEAANITELEEVIDAVLEMAQDDRTLNKMKQYKKNIKNVIQDFKFSPTKKTHPTGYAFTDACQIRQVMENDVRRACKQHIDNIDKNIYSLRNGHDKRHLPEMETRTPLTKMRRKLNFIRPYFKSGMSDIKLLAKLYCFLMYDVEGNEVQSQTRKDIMEVEVISLYCVPEYWFHQTKMFLRIGNDVK